MKHIHPMTKRGQQLTNAYWKSDKDDIRQCYKTYSREKEIVQRYCKSLMVAENGWDFRILSWNTFQFTCGFQTTSSLRIETKCNSYCISDLPF